MGTESKPTSPGAGANSGATQSFRFCAADELPEGRVLSRPIGGRAVAVARLHGGRLHAFGALCPHQQADLSHGLLEQGGITCGDHLWHFELPSGRCTNIPGAQLPVYAVREERGSIIVDVVPR